MKNFKTTYFVLPLLAANLSMSPDTIRGWESFSLSSRSIAAAAGGCNPVGDINRLGQAEVNAGKNPTKLTATCALDSKTRVVIDGEKHEVVGHLEVTWVQDTVQVKSGGAKFDSRGSNANAAKAETKIESVSQVKYVATLTVSAGDVSIIIPTKEFSVNEEGSIYASMDAQFKSGIAKLQKQVKEEEDKKKAEAQLALEVKECLKSEDGKELSLAGAINCHKKTLITLSGKDAEAYYNKNMKQNLQSMVFSGTEQERGEAQAILEKLNKGYLPASVKGSVSSLTKSAGYNNAISKLALQVQLAKQANDRTAAIEAQTQLQGLKSQMQQDLGREIFNSSLTSPMQIGGYNQQGLGASDARYYQSMLNRNLELAFKTPDDLLRSQSPGAQTGERTYDLDNSGRLNRGPSMPISGLPNVNGPQQNALNRPGYANYGPRQMMPQQGYNPMAQGQGYQQPYYGPRQMSTPMYNNSGYMPQPVMRTGGLRY